MMMILKMIMIMHKIKKVNIVVKLERSHMIVINVMNMYTYNLSEFDGSLIWW